MSYLDFFKRLCEFPLYPYQERFEACKSDLRILKVPTGLGKTNAVVLDWLRNKPTKRLIYCLPGRALTSQVAIKARELLDNAEKLDPDSKEKIEVFELMGGGEDLTAKIRPDQRAILVGTQDVLISRALNRGYALSPFRWPMDFGLLNNDVSWVFDEVQLMGEVVATSAQLAAFRRQFGTYGRALCTWMTATLNPEWLATVDFHEKPEIIELDEDDKRNTAVNTRLHAQKMLAEAAGCDTPAGCAAFVAQEHRESFLTLVITNTVARAQEIQRDLKKRQIEAELLHSRFRPCDREEKIKGILKKESGVVVSTQVIEAGADLDADLMVTDVAPWASMVQRFGRVNRNGVKPHARIFWVRQPQRGNKTRLDGTQYLPYKVDEVEKAIVELEKLKSAAPDGLAERVPPPIPYRYVLRRSDLMDLFDTTPDLAGNHIDISRFVRSGEETSVYVAWREWDAKNTPPRRKLLAKELCPVPFFPGKSEIRDWLKKHEAWTWSYRKRGDWEKVDPERVYAGMRMVVRSEAGGYMTDVGWWPESSQKVAPFEPKVLDPKERADLDRPEDSIDGDALSEAAREQSLADHTDAVVAEMEALLAAISVDLAELRDAEPWLRASARAHDWGKAHPVFQTTLHKGETLESAPEPLLAKQERSKSSGKHSRVGFRHELGSALALLRQTEFVVAYLVAAHHGKVRMSIRSVDGEDDERKCSRIARGICEGDALYAADLGGGERKAAVTLSLEAMKMGRGGWSDQAAKMLKGFGPFRLAFLELLLRSADERASERLAK